MNGFHDFQTDARASGPIFFAEKSMEVSTLRITLSRHRPAPRRQNAPHGEELLRQRYLLSTADAKEQACSLGDAWGGDEEELVCGVSSRGKRCGSKPRGKRRSRPYPVQLRTGIRGEKFCPTLCIVCSKQTPTGPHNKQPVTQFQQIFL